MRTAFFPGTFDPPTLGHLSIIKRASSLCDKLIVGIGTNAAKPDELFTVEERRAMLKRICKPYPYVEVVSFEGLAVEFAKQHSVSFLIRGLRSVCDFEYERNMALTNRNLSGIDSLFLMAEEGVTLISSTLIRELGKFNRRLHNFVPSEIEEEVFKRVSG